MMAEIIVELSARFFTQPYACCVVNELQHGRSEGLSGAVPQNDLRSPFNKQLRQFSGHYRMRRGGMFRLSRRTEIELHAYAHSGLHPVEPACQSYRLRQSISDGGAFICRAFNYNRPFRFFLHL